MAKVVSEKWKEKIRDRVVLNMDIDEIIAFRPALQWLIVYLSQSGISYKVFSIGGGVSRVTSETETCPCCKRKL